MTSLSEIRSLVEELQDGEFDANVAIERANSIAEAVVSLISQLTEPNAPVSGLFDDLLEATSLARDGYEAAQERFDDHTSVEHEALTLIAGYWQMRASAAQLEASVMRNRSVIGAAIPPHPSEIPSALSVATEKDTAARRAQQAETRSNTWEAIAASPSPPENAERRSVNPTAMSGGAPVKEPDKATPRGRSNEVRKIGMALERPVNQDSMDRVRRLKNGSAASIEDRASNKGDQL